MISISGAQREDHSAPLAASAILEAVPDLESALHDKKRLEAVARTGLLDTPPEEGFDRLTKLAAKLLGVPVTFISLVDGERDYYKSVVGLDEHLSKKRELERPESSRLSRNTSRAGARGAFLCGNPVGHR